MSTPGAKAWKSPYHDLKSSYKQFSVKGTRLHARTLYGAHVNEEMPQTPEQIAEEYGRPLEAILEAIAYCESDPPEIRRPRVLRNSQHERAAWECWGYHRPRGC